jgi:hypothetical protein
MRHTPGLALLLALALAGAGAAHGRAPVQQLFNGHDLDGWEHLGPGRFVVEDGMLRTEGGMGLLWYTREQVGHALLRVVFRMGGEEPDSGVFIRVPDPPKDPWDAINHGYEIEIGEWPSEYSRTGVVYSFSKALAHALKPKGEWNTMEILIDGPRTRVHLNGVLVTDFREGQSVPPRSAESGDPAAGPRPEQGYIGLQNHPGGTVWFREISLRRLAPVGKFVTPVAASAPWGALRVLGREAVLPKLNPVGRVGTRGSSWSIPSRFASPISVGGSKSRRAESCMTIAALRSGTGRRMATTRR